MRPGASFQSEADVARFREAAIALCGASATERGVRLGDHEVRLDAYPVGIDPDEIVEAAKRGELPAEARSVIRPDLPLVVGLERADFTKGIPERLEAVRHAFERGNAFAYVGIAAPTREGVEVYADLEGAIAEAAAQAELAALHAGSAFLHLHASIPWESVVALQREADVVFTSSLADGMNLVPLQAAIAQAPRPPAERGTILVGRDAGVAVALADYEQDGLVAVDPLDSEHMTGTLCEAVAGELPRITDRLIAAVRASSAQHWATRFLADLENATC
jgi:trehalose-6-phosphate synthase